MEFRQEWSQLWEHCNWYDFTLAQICFENDIAMGGYEFTFIILGMVFHWRWNHTRTQMMAECEEAIENILSGAGKTVPYSPTKMTDSVH